MKKVLSACIDQILEFDSQVECDRMIERLKQKHQMYSVVWTNQMDSGKFQIRIKKQYNNNDLKGVI